MRLLRNPSLLTLLLPLAWTHGATSTPTSFQPHVFDLVARQGAQGQGAALSSNSSSDSGSTDASNTTASPRMANLSPIGLGDGSGTGQPVAADDFIRVSSNKRYLVNSSSSPYYLTGLNYWACLNLAADDDYGGNQTRFLTEMDQMAAVGVNHLRIMASSEGSPTPQKFRMLPALMPAPYQWDEKIFSGLDRCIAEAGKRGMRLTMTLANTWQWSGGMGQYISWLEENNGTIPYPSSWDLSAPPQRTDGHPGWGNYTASTPDGYTVFLRYTNRFFNSTKSQDLFHAHIDQVLNRNNTLTGVLYKDDPTILAWEAANEPQVSVDAPTTNGQFNVTLLPDDPMLAWLNQTADYVKARAPKQLFTTGAEAKQGHDYFHAMHSSENIDYATSHMWVQNWGVYNDTDNNVTNLHSAMDFARTYLYSTQSWAQELDKPILLEEFGMARDNWQNVEAGRYIYHENATTTNKDTYFEMVMSTIVQYFIQGQGYFGTMPWAYGGIYRPSNQTLSSKGILFAGDPQHEGPGWYDVYSTDNVMGNIHDQQKNVSFYLNVGRA